MRTPTKPARCDLLDFSQLASIKRRRTGMCSGGLFLFSVGKGEDTAVPVLVVVEGEGLVHKLAAEGSAPLPSRNCLDISG